MSYVEIFIYGRERVDALQWLLNDSLYQAGIRGLELTYEKSPPFGKALVHAAASGAMCRYQSEQVQALGERAREMERCGQPEAQVHAWFKQEMQRLHDLSHWVEEAAIKEFEEAQGK